MIEKEGYVADYLQIRQEELGLDDAQMANRCDMPILQYRGLKNGQIKLLWTRDAPITRKICQGCGIGHSRLMEFIKESY